MTKHAVACNRCLTDNMELAWQFLYMCRIQSLDWGSNVVGEKGANYFEKVLIKGIDASSNARVCAQPFLVVGVQRVAHQPCHWAPHAYKTYARSA